MRDYMPSNHHGFLNDLEATMREDKNYGRSLRTYIESLGDDDDDILQDGSASDSAVRMRKAFNRCVFHMGRLRSIHMAVVHRYIIDQQKSKAITTTTSTSTPPPPPPSSSSSSTAAAAAVKGGQHHHQQQQLLARAAGGKGTGGTDLNRFLKPIRDSVISRALHPLPSLLSSSLSSSSSLPSSFIAAQ